MPPAVLIEFRREAPSNPPEPVGPEDIGGRQAAVELIVDESNDLPLCNVRVLHRDSSVDIGSPLIELVEVFLYAEAPSPDLCERARELATEVVTNLPAP